MVWEALLCILFYEKTIHRGEEGKEGRDGEINGVKRWWEEGKEGLSM